MKIAEKIMDALVLRQMTRIEVWQMIGGNKESIRIALSQLVSDKKIFVIDTIVKSRARLNIYARYKSIQRRIGEPLSEPFSTNEMHYGYINPSLPPHFNPEPKYKIEDVIKEL